MKFKTILASAILIAGIASLGYAENAYSPTPVSSSSKATPSVASLVGTIGSVNAQSLKLSTANGKSQTVMIDATTSIWKMGKMISVNDLKAGEKVKVRHMAKGGKYVAKSIEIL